MRINMKVLIACEESQRVCEAFRKLGHEAYSCDIIDCSGGHPEWHIKQDVLPLIDGDCGFTTCDGITHAIVGQWDLLIAHPPCTYLTVSGNRWFNEEKYGDKARDRKRLREEAAQFFMQFINAKCDHIAVENPIGYMNSTYRKPTQIIQPYYFGDPEKKSTCLWLKNLPSLIPTNIVDPNTFKLGDGKTYSEWHMRTLNLPKEERAKERSKTYLGIAQAMAEQWGGIVENV